MPLRWLGRHLMLKAKFADAVLSGRKRATIRLGRIEVRSKTFYIHSGGRIIAKAEVESVEYKKVRELTDEDARLDGFSSREELLRELRSHYGEVRDDDYVTIIRFRILERLDMAEGKLPPGVTPYEVARMALEHLELSEREEKVFRYLVKTKSLRRTAIKFYGRLSERWRIRRMLQRALSELAKRGIINLDGSEDEERGERSGKSEGRGE